MSKLFGPHQLRPLAVHRCAGLCRPLNEDERDRLRESLQHGYDPLHPIVVDAASGAICDGRNRRDVCCELDIAAVVVEREFADDAEIKQFVLAQNVARRHLDRREQRELAGRLVNGGMSTRKAAKEAGVSQMTAQRAAAKQRASESDDSVPVGSTNVDTPKPKLDPRIARVREALGLLAGMAGEIPVEVRDALDGDELVVLVTLLDALATVDSIIGRASAA